MNSTLDFDQAKEGQPAYAATLPKGSVVAVLRQSPVFQLIEDGVLLELARQCQVLVLKRGDVLLTHGDKAHGVYAIGHGWIKLARDTQDGSEAVLDVLSDGQVFGEQALLTEHGPTHSFTATAVEESRVVMMPVAALTALMKQHPGFAMGLLKTMARRQSLRDMELENRALKNAPQRIGCFLLRLCPPEQQRGEVVLHLPYDKTLLAAQLGMQPETFSRALARLKGDVGMDIQGSAVRLADVAELRRYACGGCSGTYPCEDLRAAAG